MAGQADESERAPEDQAPGAGAERVNDYLRRFGESVGAELPLLDESGYTEVRHGTWIVGITADEDHDLLMLLVRMGELPRSPTPELYRRLLELNFVATGPCAFAVDDEKGTVYLRVLRRLEGLDFEEFEAVLTSIAHVAADTIEKVPALGFLQR